MRKKELDREWGECVVESKKIERVCVKEKENVKAKRKSVKEIMWE